jgi:hypothetical protein
MGYTLQGVRCPQSIQEEHDMGSYETGTVLTCAHDGCGCRIRIEVPCHCSGAEQAYRCSCGTEMVTV